MKKALFIDRDGTLIVEPPEDFQIDSLEKLEFIPGVFRNLFLIRQFTDFELILVSNQDGMGTSRFPEEDFQKPHRAFLRAFANEGIVFDAQHIDPSLPEENSPNRKPGTGMLQEYLDGTYDLDRSFVIGDRLTDLELARNLGCKGILFGNEEMKANAVHAGLDDVLVLTTRDWDTIYRTLRSGLRKCELTRHTSETHIEVSLALDGDGRTDIRTGLGFFDHMLDQLGRHGGLDLEVRVRGDLEVDEHHTMEDTALALGEAFSRALGDKRGIQRYAFLLPMDDALVQVALDLGGRPWIQWEVDFRRERVGDVPTEMIFHFFKSFSDAARCNLSIKAEGDNDHHKIEAIFKAFARCLGQAGKVDWLDSKLPSTKGSL
ncbi:MAG: bifunctional histidinol-phosphatase/imidazoleglycerol-phosphate dehydratase HisB [Bacteroidales bacterium]